MCNVYVPNKAPDSRKMSWKVKTREAVCFANNNRGQHAPAAADEKSNKKGFCYKEMHSFLVLSTTTMLLANKPVLTPFYGTQCFVSTDGAAICDLQCVAAIKLQNDNEAIFETNGRSFHRDLALGTLFFPPD